MKALCLALCLAFSAGAFAQSPVVRWNRIVGVITAPGVDNPVGVAPNQIHSGAGPWTTRGGSAHVNLLSGEGSFEVEGLVLNGGNASGTEADATAFLTKTALRKQCWSKRNFSSQLK